MVISAIKHNNAANPMLWAYASAFKLIGDPRIPSMARNNNLPPSNAGNGIMLRTAKLSEIIAKNCKYNTTLDPSKLSTNRTTPTGPATSSGTSALDTKLTTLSPNPLIIAKDPVAEEIVARHNALKNEKETTPPFSSASPL